MPWLSWAVCTFLGWCWISFVYKALTKIELSELDLNKKTLKQRYKYRFILPKAKEIDLSDYSTIDSHYYRRRDSVLGIELRIGKPGLKVPLAYFPGEELREAEDGATIEPEGLVTLKSHLTSALGLTDPNALPVKQRYPNTKSLATRQYESRLLNRLAMALLAITLVLLLAKGFH